MSLRAFALGEALRKTLQGGLAGSVTMKKTIKRSIALAIAALWSLPASAGDLSPGTVYVAPGGVYIGSAQVYVGPGNGNGGQGFAVPGAAYVPGYGPPAGGFVQPSYGPPVYAPGYAVPAPAYTPTYVPGSRYPAPLTAYGARPTVGVLVPPYAVELAPRPPVVVPFDGGNNNCVVSHGRVFCN